MSVLHFNNVTKIGILHIRAELLIAFAIISRYEKM